MTSSSGSRRRRKAHDSPDWSELPPDITAAILQKLGPAELLETAQMVCKSWRNKIKDPSLWRSIDSFGFGGSKSRRRNMTRRAVDLSRGQLVNAKLDGGELLRYTAERAGQLRRLVIQRCQHYILTEALRKLPLLEELHVYGQLPSAKVLETIGSCCPELKSFKMKKDFYWSVLDTRDKEAIAIAKSMPRLRHLEMDGQMLTESGLRAILDGCTQLETLKFSNGDHRELVKNLDKVYPVKIESPGYRTLRHCMIVSEFDYYTNDDDTDIVEEEEEEEEEEEVCWKKIAGWYCLEKPVRESLECSD